MKITLPLPTRVTTGFRTGFIETYDADMKLVGEVEIDERITAIRYVPTVVFEYDFQAARRAAGALRLSWKAFAAVTIIPLLGGVLLMARAVAGVAEVAWDEIVYRFRELVDELRDIHEGIVSSVRHELREIAAA